LLFEFADELFKIGQPFDDDHRQAQSVVPNQVPNAVDTNRKRAQLRKKKSLQSSAKFFIFNKSGVVKMSTL
jgi:hypothetical protein